jgi:hypothetical protein
LGDRSGSSRAREHEVSDLPEVFFGPRKAAVRRAGMAEAYDQKPRHKEKRMTQAKVETVSPTSRLATPTKKQHHFRMRGKECLSWRSFSLEKRCM